MNFEKVCFACHKVMSEHKTDQLKECLIDLSERCENVKGFLSFARKVV